MKKYDIFISYRRKGGEQAAEQVYQALKKRGYSVFRDRVMRNCDFDQELQQRIRECKDAVIVITEGSLDACKNQDDWVRKEILMAMGLNKNVVPLLLDTKFPKTMPKELLPFLKMNAVYLYQLYFDSGIDRLTEYLVSKPNAQNRIKESYLVRRMLPFLLSLIIVLGAVGAGLYIHASKQFPFTKKEKALMEQVYYYNTANMEEAAGAYKEYDEALEEMQKYYNGDADAQSRSELLDFLDNKYDQMDQCSEEVIDLSDSLYTSMEKADTPLKMDDLISMPEGIRAMIADSEGKLSFLQELMYEDNLDASYMLPLIECLQDGSNLDKHYMYIAMNQLFYMVKGESLRKFKTDYLPYLRYLTEGETWSDNIDDLDAEEQQILRQMDDNENEFSAITGKLNTDASRM